MGRELIIVNYLMASWRMSKRIAHYLLFCLLQSPMCWFFSVPSILSLSRPLYRNRHCQGDLADCKMQKPWASTSSHETLVYPHAGYLFGSPVSSAAELVSARQQSLPLRGYFVPKQAVSLSLFRSLLLGSS